MSTNTGTAPVETMADTVGTAVLETVINLVSLTDAQSL